MAKAHRARPEHVRLPAPAAGGVSLEPLEGRTLFSGGGLHEGLTWGASQAVAALPRMPISADGGDTRLWPTTLAHDLINLDVFRDDPRFSGIDGRGYAAVVIDTGIDRDDPFFGPDANRNGVSDRIVYSYDFADVDGDASDTDGHGTNVSSLIAGDDPLYGGIAPGANLIHLKVFPDEGGLANFSAIERALRWVVSNAARYNIASVNMSLGETANYAQPRTDPGLSDELARLAELNVIVCASAGTEFGDFGSAQGLSYPAADPNVLAVGAVYDRNMGGQRYGGGVRATRTGPDRITPFSQRAGWMRQIFAPGAPATGAGPADALLTQQGTSQASPRVAGIALLMQQLADRILGRRLSLDEFSRLALRTGKKIVDGDDERDSVRNTGGAFRRIDISALADAMWKMAGPEIKVLMATSATQIVTLADGVSKVAFGSTTMGTSVVKTFTIENTGPKVLRLSALRTPAGFSVAQEIGDRRLSPGETTTFSIRLDGSVVGDVTGEILLASNDRDERQYSWTVTGSTRATVATIDDGTSTFTLDGDWSRITDGQGNDQRSRAAEVSVGSATWTFNKLVPGTYRVWATWAPEADLADNARYTLSDGLGGRTVRVVDQRRTPEDLVIGRVGWKEIGALAVKGDQLNVMLGGLADGRLVADSVRIERIGNLLGGGKLAISLGTALLQSDEGEQSFGSAVSGRPSTRTLVLRNVGSDDLLLGQTFTPPHGFSVVTLPAPVLKPGTSTTLTLRMDAGASGDYEGTLVLSSTDWKQPEFGIVLTGRVTPFVKMIDDGETGFSTVGEWSRIQSGYRNDHLTAAPGAAAAATWVFSNLSAGLFRVRATWAGGAGINPVLASNSVFRISDGLGNTLDVPADQRRGPIGENIQGAWWKDFGDFRIAGSSLTVQLLNEADGIVLADAIRIERLNN